jgi:hypothetical protein
MAEPIKYVFTQMRDAETVPLDELRKEIKRMKNVINFYETKQLALKKFINSVYGSTASRYFVAYNTSVAESITAQGRDLNHYSENSVNDYFEGIFQSNPKITLYYQWVHYDNDGNRITFKKSANYPNYYNVGKWEECKAWEMAVKKGKKLTPEMKSCLKDNSTGHCDWFQTEVGLWQKLGVDPTLAASFDIDKGRTTKIPKLTGPEYSYLTNNQNVSLTVAGDTDSCIFSTYLSISDDDNNKNRIKIGDLFNESKYANHDVILDISDGSEVVPVNNVNVKSYDPDLDMVVYKPIRYVMRHKVKKAKYKITTESGKSVIVTEDHSCMVIRDGELISVKTKDINPETDKIMSIC